MISEQQVRAQEKMSKLRRKLKEAKHQHKQLKQEYNQMKVELQSQVEQKSTFQALPMTWIDLWKS